MNKAINVINWVLLYPTETLYLAFAAGLLVAWVTQ